MGLSGILVWSHSKCPTQYTCHPPVISRVENKLFTWCFFLQEYDYKNLYHIFRQWNGAGSWNSPSTNVRTWLFAGSIICLLMAWWRKYPRHQKARYGHGINQVCTEYHFAFLAILMFLQKQWFLFNSVENSLDCVQRRVIDNLVILMAQSFAVDILMFPVLIRGYLS